MRTRTLDLTAITVESFCTVGNAPRSAVAEVSEEQGCGLAKCEHTEMCSVTCPWSCDGTCDSCGYSCQYCDTDETDCSTYCFKQTYVWETC